MLDLTNLDSIIENLENKRENTNNILTEQSSTLFHSFDYYKGQQNILDEILTMLKIYRKKLNNS